MPEKSSVWSSTFIAGIMIDSDWPIISGEMLATMASSSARSSVGRHVLRQHHHHLELLERLVLEVGGGERRHAEVAGGGSGGGAVPAHDSAARSASSSSCAIWRSSRVWVSAISSAYTGANCSITGWRNAVLVLGVGDEQADQVAPAPGDRGHGLGVAGVDPAGVEGHGEQLVADALVDVAVDVHDDGVESGGLGGERAWSGRVRSSVAPGVRVRPPAPGPCASCHHLPGVPELRLPKGA